MLSKTLLGIAIGYWGPEEHKAQAGKEQAWPPGNALLRSTPMTQEAMQQSAERI